MVVWVDRERFGNVPSSENFVIQDLPPSASWCSPSVDIVACGSASCISAFAKRLDLGLVVDADALAEFAAIDADVANDVAERASIFSRSTLGHSAYFKVQPVNRVLTIPAEAKEQIYCDCDARFLHEWPALKPIAKLRELSQAMTSSVIVFGRDYADGKRFQALVDSGAMLILPGDAFVENLKWVKLAAQQVDQAAAYSQVLVLKEVQDLSVETLRVQIATQQQQYLKQVNSGANTAWTRIFERYGRSEMVFDSSQCRSSGVLANFVRLSHAKCADLRPGDRGCDDICPLGYSAYRSDLGGCVSGSACSLVTLTSCMDSTLSSACSTECLTVAFGRSVLVERVVRSTLMLSNITLFLLGGLAGLIFAKVIWLSPLLDKYDALVLVSKASMIEKV